MSGRAGVVGALLCAVMLAGCTPGSAVQPTPSPTAASPTPTESAQERQERLDYAAAEKSYRTFRAEYRRVLRAGGAKQPTKLMTATAGGKYLAAFTDVVRGYRSLGSRAVGSEKIVYVEPMGYERTAIALEVCEDARAFTSIKSDGSRGAGDLRIAKLEVRRVDGAWKVWSGSGEVVKSC